MYHVPRATKGGGVCILAKHGVDVRMNETTAFKSFEYIDATTKVNSSSLRVVTVYRPPKSRNSQTPTVFFNEFGTLLESVLHHPGHLLILGDFNFHVDNIDDREGVRMTEFLEATNLEQHITCSTHNRGHTLDLMITRKNAGTVTDINTIDGLPSDHRAITCVVDLDRPSASRKEITFRKLRHIDLNRFQDDIQTSSLYSDRCTDITGLVMQYNDILRYLLDIHAPECTKVVTLRPNSKWYTNELVEMKQSKRQLERRWKKIQSDC